MNYFPGMVKVGFWMARAGVWRAAGRSGRQDRDESRRVGENQRASHGCDRNLPIRQIKHLILPGQMMVLTGHGEEIQSPAPPRKGERTRSWEPTSAPFRSTYQ